MSYVLPLHWRDDADLDDLSEYLSRLASLVAEVIVVDGSPENLVDAHREAFGDHVRHVRPDARHRCLMGKVGGVLTGVDKASHDAIVLADDDVRHDEDSLTQIAALLREADLVWPQNYFDPVPWHARWDTARTLLNRAVSHDFPGTVGVRRSTLLRISGYRGDALFENLELRRTIEAFGGLVATPLDLYVRRVPPTTQHFLSQRVRQAYDELARPLRLAAFLAIGPAAVALAESGRWRWLAAAAAGAVGVAELGRRRSAGASRFPPSTSLFAPAWIAERAVTSWIAVWQRLAYGGVLYGGRRIRSAATPMRILRERARAVQPAPVHPASPAASNVALVQ